MKKIRTIKEIDLEGKRILLRADFNVPIENGEVKDDWRIRATLPTIHFLLSRNCRVTICSHLGRPKGKRNSDFSLKPVAVRLAKLLNQKVIFADDCIGENALKLFSELKTGEVLLLENTRFHSAETDNDPDFAQELSRYGDLFVDDAFAVAHRKHASNVGVAHILPSTAGLLIEREMDALSKAVSYLERPLIAIFGGIKISDKLDAIKKIGQHADFILFGGGFANTAFRAQGLEVGRSKIDESSLSSMTDLFKRFGDKIIMPTDVVVRHSNNSIKTLDPKCIPADAQILDVGDKTVETFLKLLKTSRKVIWNGPLGYFEKQPFDKGTLALACGLSEMTARVYVGGGDTGLALAAARMREKVTHASTGGGAFLGFLAGKPLPGLVVLPRSGKWAA